MRARFNERGFMEPIAVTGDRPVERKSPRWLDVLLGLVIAVLGVVFGLVIAGMVARIGWEFMMVGWVLVGHLIGAV